MATIKLTGKGFENVQHQYTLDSRESNALALATLLFRGIPPAKMMSLLGILKIDDVLMEEILDAQDVLKGIANDIVVEMDRYTAEQQS
jgi:hypothetical protein